MRSHFDTHLSFPLALGLSASLSLSSFSLSPTLFLCVCGFCQIRSLQAKLVLEGIQQGAILGFVFLSVAKELGVPFKALRRWMIDEPVIKRPRDGETEDAFKERQSQRLRVLEKAVRKWYDDTPGVCKVVVDWKNDVMGFEQTQMVMFVISVCFVIIQAEADGDVCDVCVFCGHPGRRRQSCNLSQMMVSGCLCDLVVFRVVSKKGWVKC